MTTDFDVIVIGSGIGGLGCGALLAHEGMKVLVLEQHSKIGGYAHNFKRRKFSFESGIHSVPMAPDGLVMHLFKHLGIESSIECVELPSMYRIESPYGKYTMPSRYCDIIDYLKALNCSRSEIPFLENVINQFYEGICTPVINSTPETFQENISFMSQYHNLSYHDHIEKLISNKELLTVLSGQWPYAGISAMQGSALFSFMMFLVHAREGSHSCKGGFSSIAHALGKVIVDRGGLILTRQCVTSLNVDDGRVSRVVTEDGSEYSASLFISNISPYILHHELLPNDAKGKRWIRRLGNLNPSVSSVIVYLGMKPEVVSLLPDSINFWFDSWDFESIYRNIYANRKETLDHLILLRGLDEGDSPTLTLMNLVRQDYSNNWKNDKMIIAEKMIKKLETHYPGIRELIELMEVGSPDTLYRYTKNTAGALYGFENVKDIYGEAKLPVTTHLPNLYQTGHWGRPGGGVWNVLFNAWGASRVIVRNQKGILPKKAGYRQ